MKSVITGWYSNAGKNHRHYFLEELGKFVCGLKCTKHSRFGHHKPTCCKCEQQVRSIDVLGLETFLQQFKRRVNEGY